MHISIIYLYDAQIDCLRRTEFLRCGGWKANYKEAFVEERLFTKQSNSSECLFINKQLRGIDCLQINIRAGLIVCK